MHTVHRLFDYFQPEHYRLELDIDRLKRVYSGTVVISGTKISDDQPIRVHAKDVRVGAATINGSEAQTTLDQDDEIIIGGELPAGDYSISVDFKGEIAGTMIGMYLCSYTEDGQEKELIATQFESHFARNVFPCIDEPEAKATFDLTLVTEPDVTVRSNTPQKEQITRDDGRMTTSFETTPRMSSYLLAWVYGDLQQITARTSRGVEVNVLSTKVHDQNMLEHALDVTTKTIDFFEDYYGTEYPLAKCDLVALPDFSAGAMENWGLITFREVCLLASPNAAQSTKEYTATVIAHELAHQWFGNLVTMKWWDELWLNESFANIMMYTAVDAIYPEWNIWQLFMASEIPLALQRDQFPNIQPVQSPICHPDEINAQFDKGIVYAKGSRLIRMAEAYVGRDDFRKGLKLYFEKYGYGNASGEELWTCISKASGKDVRSFMQPWLNQPGYPIVSVATADDGVILGQQEFRLEAQAPTGELWPILYNNPDTQQTAVFTTPDHILPALSHSYLPNKEVIGHYITTYDETTWTLFLANINENIPSAPERGAALYEHYILALNGYLPTQKLIELLSLLRHESSNAVWSLIEHVAGELQHFQTTQPKIWHHVCEIIAGMSLDKIAVLDVSEQSNDTSNDKRIRASALRLLALSQHQPTIEHCLEVFHSHANLQDIAVTLRPTIFKVAARYGDSQDFTRLCSAYLESTDPELRDQLAQATPFSSDLRQIADIISWLQDSSRIKPQDTARWFSHLMKNLDAQRSAWEWMTSQWPWIIKTFEDDMSLEKFITLSARSMAGDERYESYKTFFTDNRIENFSRSIDIGLMEIHARTAWIKRAPDQTANTIM